MDMLAEHIDEIEALAEPGAAAERERLRELAASLAGALEQEVLERDAAYAVLRAALLLAPELASRDLNQSLRSIAAHVDRVPREIAEELATDISAFRHLAAQWEEDCKGLPEPLCPAQPVLESIEAYLHDLYSLRRTAEGGRCLIKHSPNGQWLAERLAKAEQEAAELLRTTPVRRRLWAVLPEARRLGLGELVPPLREVLMKPQESQSPTTRGFPAWKLYTDSSGDPAIEAAERVADHERRFPRNLMWAAAHGRLVEEDVALVKRLVSHNPARWAEAYRHALHHDGFPALAYLEKVDGAWTAPPLLRLPPEAVRSQLRLGPPETPQRALPPPGELEVRRADLPANIEAESLFVASARVEIAGIDVRVYGDERGLWCLAARNGNGGKARCAYTKEDATGWHAQIPLLQTGPQGGFPALRFRPGPLRSVLTDPDFPLVDRACSRRAYVITIGESSLRNLLGWELREVAARFHAIVPQSEVRDGRELVRLLFRDDALSVPWIAAVPTAERGPRQRGLRTLGEVARSITELPAQEISAEVATVEELSGDLAPVDGDEFVLIPTRTGTSILAAQIVRRRLAAKFPHSRIRVSACDAMKQRRDLSETRSELPEEPLDAAYHGADAEVARLLVDEAADPVLVVSGGAKWESEAMLDLGADRRLPVAYRFESGRPVVFRWDRMPAEEGRKREEPLSMEEASSRYLVLTVGISLLLKSRKREPSADELLDWAKKQDRALYTLCAELTGFEAWRKSRGVKGPLEVALIRTRPAKQETYAPGQVCAAVVRRLLEEQGVRVHAADAWDILDFSDIKRAPPEQQMVQLERELRRPIAQCLDEVIRAAEMPDVLASGGQKLAASVLHLAGRVRGCRVYLAPEAEEGQQPVLWRVWAPGTRPELKRGDVLDAEYLRVS
jgi:CRISPR/Cas system-associated protein Csm6